MEIKFRKLHEDAVLPKYAKEGDTGLDLTAVRVTHEVNGLFTIYTGLAVEIPSGYAGFIYMRSPVFKIPSAPMFTNCVGVIDSGYRGELKAIVRILNKNCAVQQDAPYKAGERFAQFIILPYPKIEPEWVDSLSDSERGEGGFGHTGN